MGLDSDLMLKQVLGDIDSYRRDVLADRDNERSPVIPKQCVYLCVLVGSGRNESRRLARAQMS